MLARPCLRLQPHAASSSCSPSASLVRQRLFHTTTPRGQTSSASLNHYEALGLPTTASPGEIKKQFYQLSKSNHPDLRPNDPAAAQKFVRISEAYATLGSAEKRLRYDRHVLRADAASPPSASASRQRGGSFSSAQTPAGGRPASGLSRRRTQFRGPPPSFYRSGGWGAHDRKRSEHFSQPSHSHEAGTGPGGFASGRADDVPHFDYKSHHRTLSEVERNRHRSRQQRRVNEAELEEDASGGGGGGSVVWNFFLLSGLLGISWAVSGIMIGSGRGSVEVRGRGKNRER